MASILTTLSDEKIMAQHQTMSRESLSWLNKRVTQLRNPTTIVRKLVRDTDRHINPTNKRKFLMGGLYFFAYDPKTKEDMPYYDTFPLVMPLRRDADGFMGLNLHYLPIRWRINFMKKLLPLAIYNDDDEIKRIRITYPILSASSQYDAFRPCIKKYLYSHMRSKIIAIEPEEWDIALYLPIQQFRKAPVSTVWQNSVEQIRAS